eukprot:TRINITY_DN8753_c0_g1_i1.p1 TRINITY_DN8753_c0_g1~~TRINITY_DN8753_c0_g1_i1.p1  ORF type:complete len:354 (-),score=127.88 TRINITY_DN8753_c0_g1_i1:124-1185(-)
MEKVTIETIQNNWQTLIQNTQVNSNFEKFQAATKLPVLRVNQLDAYRLDCEIFELLRAQLIKSCSLLSPSFSERFQPELKALLRAIIFKLSLYSTNSTYGNSLQNLEYRDETFDYGSHILATSAKIPPSYSQKLLYAFATIFIPYIWERVLLYATWNNWSSRSRSRFDWRYKVWKCMRMLDNILHLANLINFIVFLFDGCYPQLIDRLIRIRLVYSKKSLSRQVNFEYMNSQLVRVGFTEFLLFIIPLLQIEKLKRIVINKIRKLWQLTIRKRINFGSSYLNTQEIDDNLKLSEIGCTICSIKPINTPVISNCSHFFCYYCLQVAITRDNGETPCPKCANAIKLFRRVSKFDF